MSTERAAGPREGSVLALARGCFERALLWICIAILVSLASLVMGAVIFRRLGQSLTWYDEVASVLMVWLTYFGCGLAALRGAHLDFSSLLMQLPQAIRLGAYFLGKVVSLTFFVVIAWAGYAVLEIFADETLITVKWMPLSVTQAVLPIGCVLFIIAELLVLPDGVAKVRAGIGRDEEEIRDAIEAAEKRQ